jgi:sarcosine oxidase gamma subunit
MPASFARRVALAVAALVAFVAPAYAGDVTFVMNNHHQNAVEVQLYSQDRDFVWPGPDEVFLLDDGETKTMSLACEDGESICYGAWISGDESTFWGVGPGKTQTCDNCCYTCQGGDTEQINLAP